MHHTGMVFEAKPVMARSFIGKVVGEACGGRHHTIRCVKDTIAGCTIDRIQQLVAEAGRGPTPKNSPDRIIFMSMLNGIELNRAGNDQMCILSAQHVADFSDNFKPGHWCHTGPASEESWNYDTNADTRGKWDAVAETMTDIFAQSEHPFSSCGIDEERDRSTPKAENHHPFTAGTQNVQMLMKLVLSCGEIFFRSPKSSTASLNSLTPCRTWRLYVGHHRQQ